MSELKNLELRKNFWGRLTTRTEYKPSHLKLKNYINLVKNKSILEIGPGTGAEYLAIRSHINNYNIADISQAILNQDIFNNIDNKFLITDYDQNLNQSFDIIISWFVIHHIDSEEILDMINFIYTHVKTTGYFIGNYPSNEGGKYRFVDLEDNYGIKTTRFAEGFVLNCFEQQFLIKDYGPETKLNNYIICQK